VIYQERRLRDLAWQYVATRECQSPFGYVQSSAQTKNDVEATCESLTAGPDHGYGTYFVARTKAEYQVTVIARPSTEGASANGTALIVLQDNGPPADCP
jgi:hypothetical protein